MKVYFTFALLYLARLVDAFAQKKIVEKPRFTSTMESNKKLLPKIVDAASLRSIAAVALISMPLGVSLDNQHGLFNVLTYLPASFPIDVSFENQPVLKTALFVPFLFGAAGAAMSYIVLTLDEVMNTRAIRREPTWPKVFFNIGIFSLQYYISGLLDYLETPSTDISLVLAASGVLGYLAFDSTAAGLLLALLTSVAGPVAEISLTELGLYQYNHADVYKICSWIPFVYFLGASAVGNLARRLRQDFSGL